MSPFSRALKYPLRYKRYLVVAVVCALVGGMCYGGGIGAAYPILKTVISREGLHGWADVSLTEQMMGIDLLENRFSKSFDAGVAKVQPGSPAQQAGLKQRDIITEIDGQRVVSLGEFAQAVAAKQTGEIISLTWKGLDGEEELQGSLVLGKARWYTTVLARMVRWLPRGVDNRWWALCYIMAAFWLINLLRFVMRFIQEFSAGVMIERGLMDLRIAGFRKALRLPLSYYDRQGGASDASSRFLKDVPAIKRGMKTVFTLTMLEPFRFLGALAIALFWAWKLTIIILIMTPIIAFLLAKFAKIMKKATRRALQTWGRILGILNETLSNIRVVKAYGTETYERKRFFQANRNLVKYLIRVVRTDVLAPTTTGILAISMVTAGLLLAGKQVLPPNPSMDTEALFTFFAAVVGMSDSLRRLSSVPNKFHAANAAAKRVFALMDQPEEPQKRQAPELKTLAQQIEFQNVTFTYPDASNPALKDINLLVPKGQTVALVGPNGSGKTTLISLLPRFFDPDTGTVAFDGQDIREVKLHSLRKQMAMVTQQTVIFADTVAANIAYGQKQTPRKKIVAAAKRAYAHEFIELLPQGYDTVLSEAGGNLSGGQRQRISIARAVMRDPEILILDEATSSIDADSEAKISQTLEEFTVGRTCLIVAHRFATVMAADFIVVMDKGRIVAIGSHEELVASCPLYHGLYETQFIARQSNNEC